jgi:hypothetical protein
MVAEPARGGGMFDLEYRCRGATVATVKFATVVPPRGATVMLESRTFDQAFWYVVLDEPDNPEYLYVERGRYTENDYSETRVVVHLQLADSPPGTRSG